MILVADIGCADNHLITFGNHLQLSIAVSPGRSFWKFMNAFGRAVSRRPPCIFHWVKLVRANFLSALCFADQIQPTHCNWFQFHFHAWYWSIHRYFFSVAC
jgi:hypothetical protein